jgi:hypothetical protein
MKPFIELRQLATERRDKAIRAAQSEYRKTLKDIASMERRLGLVTLTRYEDRRPPLTEAILAVIPQDQPFSLDDVCQRLSAADPVRTFTKGSIRSTICVLVNRGDIKRVQNNGGTRCAAYAASSLNCAEPESSMFDRAEAILRDAGQPMTVTEIVVAMIEQGFNAAIEPNRATDSLRRGLTRRTDRFRKDGQKWTLRQTKAPG